MPRREYEPRGDFEYRDNTAGIPAYRRILYATVTWAFPTLTAEAGLTGFEVAVHTGTNPDDSAARVAPVTIVKDLDARDVVVPIPQRAAGTASVKASVRATYKWGKGPWATYGLTQTQTAAAAVELTRNDLSNVVPGTVTFDLLTESQINTDNLWPNPTSEIAPPAAASGTELASPEWAWRTASGSAHAGGFVRERTRTGVGSDFLGMDVPAAPGDIFYFEAMARVTAGTGVAKVMVQAMDASKVALATYTATTVAGSWTKISIQGTMPAGTCYCRLNLQAEATGASVTCQWDAMYARRTVGVDILGFQSGAVNLLRNASMEVDSNNNGFPDGWDLANNDQAAQPITPTLQSNGYQGSWYWRAAWGVNSTGYKGIRTDSTIVSGMTQGGVVGGWQLNQWYTVSVFMRATGAAVGQVPSLRWTNAPQDLVTVSAPALTGTFQRYVWRVRWTASAEANGSLQVVITGAVTGSLDFDAAMVVEGELLTAFATRPIHALDEGAARALSSTEAAATRVWYRGNNNTAKRGGAPTLMDPFWTRSTSYAVGDRVAASPVTPGTYPFTWAGGITNAGAPTRVYECTQAGQSSGAGAGPTGVGTGIADNTCVWKYVEENLELLSWARSTVYGAGNQVLGDPYGSGATPPYRQYEEQYSYTIHHLGFNVTTTNSARRVYECTVGGTSAAAGVGPTGTGSAIGDNTVTWKHLRDNVGPPWRLQLYNIEAIGVTGLWSMKLEGMITPRSINDNLDALRYLRLDFTSGVGFGMALETVMIPISDRLYAVPTEDARNANRLRFTTTWLHNVDPRNASAPNQFQGVVRATLFNAYGESDQIDFISVNNQLSSAYTPTVQTGLGMAPSSGGGGGGSGGEKCVGPDTPVLMDANGACKNAGDVVPGDFVWTKPDYGDAFGRHRVLRVERAWQPRVRVWMEDGRSFLCSKSHLLSSHGQWRRADSLAPGDVLEGRPDGVVKVVEWYGWGEVVRFKVEHAATFYDAAGMFHHNATSKP